MWNTHLKYSNFVSNEDTSDENWEKIVRLG